MLNSSLHLDVTAHDCELALGLNETQPTLKIPMVVRPLQGWIPKDRKIVYIFGVMAHPRKIQKPEALTAFGG